MAPALKYYLILVLLSTCVSAATLTFTNTTVKTLDRAASGYNLDAGEAAETDVLNALGNASNGGTCSVRIRVPSDYITAENGSCTNGICTIAESNWDGAIAQGCDIILASEGTNAWNQDTSGSTWNCGGSGTDCPPSNFTSYFNGIFNFINVTFANGDIGSYYSRIIGYDPGNEMHNPSFWLDGYTRCSVSRASFYNAMYDNATERMAARSGGNIQVLMPSLAYDCIDDMGPAFFNNHTSGVVAAYHNYCLSDNPTTIAEGTTKNCYNDTGDYMGVFYTTCEASSYADCSDIQIYITEAAPDSNQANIATIMQRADADAAGQLMEMHMAFLNDPQIKLTLKYLLTWPYSCFTSGWEDYGNAEECGASNYSLLYNQTRLMNGCFQDSTRVVSTSSDTDQVFIAGGEKTDGELCFQINNFEASSQSITLDFSTHNVSNVTDVETGTVYNVSAGSVSLGSVGRNTTRFFTASIAESSLVCSDYLTSQTIAVTATSSYYVANSSCSITKTTVDPDWACTDEIDATPLDDITGNGNDIVSVIGGTYNETYTGYTFPGSSGRYLNISDGAQFDFINLSSTGFTVGAWFNMNNVPTNTAPVFLQIRSSNDRFVFGQRTSTSFTCGYYNGTSYVNTRSGTLNVGAWAFALCLWTPSASSLLLNGVNSTSSDNPSIGGTIGTSIGGDRGSRNVNGTISEVYIWDRILNSTEISDIYANITVTGMYAHYSFQNTTTCEAYP